MNAPLKISLIWMLGTFAVFLLFGDSDGLENPVTTITFVLGAAACWALGYRWGARSFSGSALERRVDTGRAHGATENRWTKPLIVASSIYFILYSLMMLKAYGATPSSILAAFQDPGKAYAAKFEIIETLATKDGQTLLQVLILLSFLQLPLAPLAAFTWDQLSNPVRIIAVTGASFYILFFAYIGTMQGIGFLLVGLIAGLMAKRHAYGTNAPPRRRRPSSQRRRYMIMIALGVASFSTFMVNAQASRLDTFDTASRFPANPAIQAIAGENFARGVAVLVHYPTHGYRGLDFDFSSPFVWTKGRGASRAIDSYWTQYVGGDEELANTYPMRTESSSGWSGTLVWSTVYPWLASDLTFPGVLLLMLLLGRITARMWICSIRYGDPICLMLWSQLLLFVIFIPANNQVLISRPALIAVVSCIIVHFAYDRHSGSRRLSPDPPSAISDR